MTHESERPLRDWTVGDGATNSAMSCALHAADAGAERRMAAHFGGSMKHGRASEDQDQQLDRMTGAGSEDC
jgi:hypothetical protein